MFVPPPGDAFNFVANVNILPIAWINLAISGGLLWIYLHSSTRIGSHVWKGPGIKDSEDAYEWNPPYRAGIVAVSTFFFSNLFLFIAPIIPPKPEFKLYDHLPYWVSVFQWFVLSHPPLLTIYLYYITYRWLVPCGRYSVCVRAWCDLLVYLDGGFA